jgi:hypothetical protein
MLSKDGDSRFAKSQPQSKHPYRLLKTRSTAIPADKITRVRATDGVGVLRLREALRLRARHHYAQDDTLLKVRLIEETMAQRSGIPDFAGGFERAIRPEQANQRRMSR